MTKPLGTQSPPDAQRHQLSQDRPSSRFPKRVPLLVLTFIFSLCSIGLLEDVQQNLWLKYYLLIATLLWGNLLIYLSVYPRVGQRLITLIKSDSDQK